VKGKGGQVQKKQSPSEPALEGATIVMKKGVKKKGGRGIAWSGEKKNI